MSLIRRHHLQNGIRSEAVYSSCERYRYALTRVWDDAKPHLFYIMLNPSKATEVMNDPTIERCQRRATRLGYGAMRIGNIFAWRETEPAALKRADLPIGEDNDSCLCEGAGWADEILCAWGVHGAHEARGQNVANQLRATGRRLLCLGTTKDGHPRHPLYVSYDVKPVVWR